MLIYAKIGGLVQDMGVSLRNTYLNWRKIFSLENEVNYLASFSQRKGKRQIN